MGGYLSRPYDKFPIIFGAQFWRTYPYILPCGCAALISLICLTVVAVFFEEVRIITLLPVALGSQCLVSWKEPPISKKTDQAEVFRRERVYGFGPFGFEACPSTVLPVGGNPTGREAADTPRTPHSRYPDTAGHRRRCQLRCTLPP